MKLSFFSSSFRILMCIMVLSAYMVATVGVVEDRIEWSHCRW